jgi:hypothetical protein
MNALRWSVALVALLCVVVASVYLARRMIAREVLVGWLDSRGIEADVDIERFELNGLVARVRVGPAESPDLTIERVEVAYSPRGFWAARPLGVDLASVRLVRPVLRAAWRDGKLSVGSLDRLVEELLSRPPDPDATKPLVLIEGGRARLDSEFGLLAIQASGRVEDARLISLDARLGPTELRGPRLRANLDGGTITLRTSGDRVRWQVRLDAPDVAQDGLAATGVVATLDGEGPYPDLEKQKSDGLMSSTLKLAADGARQGENEIEAGRLTARFEGRVSGWGRELMLTGPVQAGLNADAVRTRDGRLEALDTGFTGQARWSSRDWRVQGTFSGAANGSTTVLGAPKSADSRELRLLKRALSRFTVRAPAIGVSASGETLRVRLPAPVRLTSPSGAYATLSATGGQLVYDDGAGALRAQVGGGGLPEVDLTVPRYALAEGALTARLAARVEGAFGPVEGGVMSTSGDLAASNGALRFTQAGCQPILARRLELGETDLTDIAGRLCPTGRPLVVVGPDGWRVAARVEALGVEAPFLEARAQGASASLGAQGRGDQIALNVDSLRGRLVDTAAEERFRPVDVAGQVAMASEKARGRFELFDPDGRALGLAELSHDLRTGRGGVSVDTGEIAFSPEGLQPADLSPLATVIGSQVAGRARFAGGVDWDGEGLASGGVLTVPGLDFKSAAGPVAGLSGRIEFTSLIPLETAPGQHLDVARIDSLAPLTQASLDFQFLGDLLKIQAGSVDIGGGRLDIEPMTARLDGQAFEGVINVHGVQLSELVARSPFADRVSLDARVSGRLPFVLGPEGIRFINGRLEAIEPGRLSIRREALVAVSAEGGQAQVVDGPAGAVAPPQETNTVTEFAFQALEHLAFDSLSAEVNSLPEGRLGVLFRIAGAHEPPQEQTLELGLLDLLKKDLLQRRLPLPSHTKVNLTLDTTLNLDQLLKDFAETQRAGSAAVQP